MVQDNGSVGKLNGAQRKERYVAQKENTRGCSENC